MDDKPPPAVDRREDVGDITLVWGNSTRWKAQLREESAQRHQQLPIAERLRAALALVIPRSRQR